VTRNIYTFMKEYDQVNYLMGAIQHDLQLLFVRGIW